MKFSFSSIGQNILSKLPLIILLAMMVLGTMHFNQTPTRTMSSGAQGTAAQNAAAQNENAKSVAAQNENEQQWKTGYAGEVPVSIVLDAAGKIDTVELGMHNETRSYIKKLQRDGLFDRWDGLTLTEVASAPTDAVSGATYSSTAIIANVRAEAARISNTTLVETNDLTPQWWVGQIVVWLVLLLAVVSYLFPAKMKRWRWVLLGLSVLFVGFWQGAFLSMQLLYNYVINGSSLLQITLTIILVLSIAAPLLFNKSFYCQYLCPFGMLQEATGKIPVRKIKISPRAAKIFTWTRRLTFVGFVVLLWVNPHFEPGEWEPFSSFIALRDVVNFSAISVLVIAGVSVVMSVVMPRAWCRTLCPLGEFFSLLQSKPNYKIGRKK